MRMTVGLFSNFLMDLEGLRAPEDLEETLKGYRAQKKSTSTEPCVDVNAPPHVKLIVYRLMVREISS
jgi:hypothetical protein